MIEWYKACNDLKKIRKSIEKKGHKCETDSSIPMEEELEWIDRKAKTTNVINIFFEDGIVYSQKWSLDWGTGNNKINHEYKLSEDLPRHR